MGVPNASATWPSRWSASNARLSSFMRFCSANNVAPNDVDESAGDRFGEYRLRCGKPVDDAFRRLLARAWNGWGRCVSSSLPNRGRNNGRDPRGCN
jgi:hypothetical protein